MIDFEHVNVSGDDFWFDHESQVVERQIAQFTAVDWQALASELTFQKATVQDRIAQILGHFDIEPAADVLLSLAASTDREVTLTARESLRGLSLQVVTASTKRLTTSGQLVSTRSLQYESINEILDAIEAIDPSTGSVQINGQRIDINRHLADFSAYIGSPSSGWHEYHVSLGTEMADVFTRDDWSDLGNLWRGFEAFWQERCCECLGDSQALESVQILAAMLHSEFADVSTVAVSQLLEKGWMPTTADIRKLIELGELGRRTDDIQELIRRASAG